MASLACRIIELDTSDGSVSGTKCTDEFVAAFTKALIYRLFSEVLRRVLRHSKAERERDGALLFVSRAAEVKSQTETYIVDVSKRVVCK